MGNPPSGEEDARKKTEKKQREGEFHNMLYKNFPELERIIWIQWFYGTLKKMSEN